MTDCQCRLRFMSEFRLSACDSYMHAKHRNCDSRAAKDIAQRGQRVISAALHQLKFKPRLHMSCLGRCTSEVRGRQHWHDQVCETDLSAFARLDAVGDVQVDKLCGQVHSCGQPVDYLHAVQAQTHGDQNPQVLTHLAAVHQPQQGLHQMQCHFGVCGPNTVLHADRLVEAYAPTMPRTKRALARTVPAAITSSLL